MVKVLIAEDNFSIREIMRSFLVSLGYAVVTVPDGAEAISILHPEHDVQIVITDWMMPRKCGLDIIKHLRSRPAGVYVYVIVISAITNKAGIIECLDAGANDYITKPLDLAELKARMHTGARLVSLEKERVRQNQELREWNELLTKELKAAADVQKSFLPPSVMTFGYVTVAHLVQPCSHLGGDTLNVFPLDDTHLGFYVLDVSGHGVVSALMAVMLSQLLSPDPNKSSLLKRRAFTAFGSDIVSPGNVALELNKQFQIDATHDQYFTMFYGVLDTTTLILHYVSAGFPDILHQTTDGTIHHLEQPGFPIGFMEDADFPTYKLSLKPGDRLYIYSDGLVEASYPGKGQFGVERLAAIAVAAGQPLPDALKVITGQVEAWCENEQPADDLSIMGIEISLQAQQMIIDGLTSYFAD